MGHPLRHQTAHLVVAGIAAFAFFGEGEFAVNPNVEDTAAALDQLDFGCGLFPDQLPRTEGAW